VAPCPFDVAHFSLELCRANMFAIASTYAGVWSPTATYSQGRMVLRTAGAGSPGPFFVITSAPPVGSDPASDSTDWAYCRGTPTLGYTPFSTTGSLPTSFATSSSQTLLSYTFNADDAQTIFFALCHGITVSIQHRPEPFKFLEKACSEKSLDISLFLKSDLLFDDLRPGPRFQSLLRRMSLPT
jgi:hypothetical protein